MSRTIVLSAAAGVAGWSVLAANRRMCHARAMRERALLVGEILAALDEAEEEIARINAEFANA